MQQRIYRNHAIRVMAIIREEAMKSGLAHPIIALDGGDLEPKRGDHEVQVRSAVNGTALISIKEAWFDSGDAASEMELRGAVREALKTLDCKV